MRRAALGGHPDSLVGVVGGMRMSVSTTSGADVSIASMQGRQVSA